MNKKTKKRLSIVANIVITIFLVFAVALTIYATIIKTSSDGVPSIGNKVLMSIKTDSMEGENGFNQGSLIISYKLTEEQKDKLKVGDVITFWANQDIDKNGERDDLNTHRIVKVSFDGDTAIYTTKGDNTPADDGEILSNKVVAIWQSEDFEGEKLAGKKVNGLGSFLMFMTSQIGFLLIIVLPLFIFFVFELVNLIKVVGQIRGKKTITASDEEEIKRKAIEEYLKSQSADKVEEKPVDNNDETKE